MLNSLALFNKNIEDLRNFVEIVIFQQNELFASVSETGETELEIKLLAFQKQFDSIKTAKRVFDYSTVIISLYGFLERFIENSAKEYLSSLNKIFRSYRSLPQAILDNHYELSATLLTNLKLDKYRNTVTKESIIKNLYSCTQNTEQYSLNIEAYTQHTANFRREKINDFFACLGIPGISTLVKKQERFKRYIFKVMPEIEPVYHNVHESVIYQILDDLAQRRNDISHGSESIQILSPNLLIDYIEYIDCYVNALSDVIIKNLLPYEVENCSVELEKPIAIYNNRVICLNLGESLTIAVGDRIIARSNLDGNTYMGRYWSYK